MRVDLPEEEQPEMARTRGGRGVGTDMVGRSNAPEGFVEWQCFRIGVSYFCEIEQWNSSVSFDH